MAFSYRELFFGGTKFCCCLPVRVGVIIMSILGMLFAGLLSILLWFEVDSSPNMSKGERTVFIITGLVETLLFVASILGFVGAVVRKQVFVQIYAYFLYFHFLLNVGVAAYLLWFLVHASTSDQVKACQEAIKNTQAQSQCTGLFKIGLGVYGAVAGIVLLTEMYGAIIVARYVNQIQREKRTSKIQQGAFRLGGKPNGGRYSTIKGEEDDIPLRSARQSKVVQPEFDPYNEVDHRTAYDGMPQDPEHGSHDREVSEERRL
ncbi:hypothetical protein FB45DRAFT_892900 [Roridomyces roridus]|uniref:Uncharacterized protein n=1 Tax=Roridomyces roridus TaxID=1738132 RepID=A0AAD7CF37_9AGAR|nr:hypothetical protein FB45DRAFT_892900 [Roridomyces roridus]